MQCEAIGKKPQFVVEDVFMQFLESMLPHFYVQVTRENMIATDGAGFVPMTLKINFFIGDKIA